MIHATVWDSGVRLYTPPNEMTTFDVVYLAQINDLCSFRIDNPSLVSLLQSIVCVRPSAMV